jgi:hypothetical protein
MEHGRHVVFYRQAAGGIPVSRILRQRMLPETAEHRRRGQRVLKVRAAIFVVDPAAVRRWMPVDMRYL